MSKKWVVTGLLMLVFKDLRLLLANVSNHKLSYENLHIEPQCYAPMHMDFGKM